MVGVPRSKGCALCVKRRVRCDENRPGCGNCEKYGIPCVGYDKSHKFVTGKHQVRSRKTQGEHGGEYGSVITIGTSTAPTSTGLGGSSASPDPSRQEPLSMIGQPGPSDNGISFSSKSAAQTSPSFPPLQTSITSYASFIPYGTVNRGFASIPDQLRTPVRPFVYNMLETLFSLHPRHEVALFAPWFTSVLDELGKRTLLDKTMCAFTMHLAGKAKHNEDEVRQSRTLYGQALGALQKSLNSPIESKSPETLCATMLLCNFELFAGTKDASSWMMHAAGVSRLIEYRGPDAINSPMEKALLLSFRPLIITYCLFSGQPCFFAQKRWAAKLTDICNEAAIQPILPPAHVGTDYTLATIPRSMIKHADAYFLILSSLPLIMKRGYELREQQKHGTPMTSHDIPKLCRDAADSHALAEAWYETFVQDLGQPVEVASNDPTSPFATTLSYSSPWLGAMHINYWATMLILQECMNLCRGNMLYKECNDLLARNILRSVEYVGQGIMGSYRIGYPLRIAYDFVNGGMQKWIINCIGKREHEYAAISPETYPAPETEEARVGSEGLMGE